MATRDEVISFYKLLYPTPPYNVRLLDLEGNVAVHDLCFNVEEIVENYELLHTENLHWYISVNPYRRDYGRIVKTGIVNKIVLDFDSENPNNTIKDAREMYLFLKSKGKHPLCFTSGRKGIHIHFRIRELKNVDRGIKEYFDRFDYPTLDKKVYADQSARITRIPGTMHPLGGGVKLVDIESADNIDDLLEIPLCEVEFQAPGDPGQMEQLFTELNKPKPRPKFNKVYLSKYMSKKSIQNWNVMDKVFPMIYETGKHVNGSKHIVSCPFHNDRNPSAFYNDKLFHCSSCNISVGVYNLLIEHTGKSKKEALDIIKSVQ